MDKWLLITLMDKSTRDAAAAARDKLRRPGSGDGDGPMAQPREETGLLQRLVLLRKRQSSSGGDVVHCCEQFEKKKKQMLAAAKIKPQPRRVP